jgi:hypothetical protein
MSLPDCRPENFEELQDDIKKLYATVEDMDDKNLMIVCDFKGMEDVAIKTTNETIKAWMKLMAKDNNNIDKIFKEYFKRMVCYTETKDEIYEKGGKDWDDLSDDVMIYYCARALKFKKAIPVVLCD